jgi:hypothetical protein
MVSLAPLGPEFQPFLQSKLWADKDETPLTVLSALARLDVDAWQEAAELAALPKVRAEKRLADRLRALPGAPSTALEVDTLCGRSVSLLPQGPTLGKGLLAKDSKTVRSKSNVYILALTSVYLLIGTWVAVVYMLSLAAPPASPREAAPSAPSVQATAPATPQVLAAASKN